MKIRLAAMTLALIVCCSGCVDVTVDWLYTEMPVFYSATPDSGGPGDIHEGPDATPEPPADELYDPKVEIARDTLLYYELAAAMEENYGAGNPVVTNDSGVQLDDETVLAYLSMIIPRYIGLSIEERTADGVVTSVIYECTFPLSVDRRFAEAEAELRAVVDDNITPGMSDREKLLLIHDWVVEHNVYPDVYDDESRSAAALVFNGNAVCSGYTDAVMIMCGYARIPCVNVHGTAVNTAGVQGNHGWNAVFVEGQWLHLDATFDDPKTKDGTNVLKHDYFLVTTEEIQQNHFFDMVLTWEEQLNFINWYYFIK